MTYRLISSPDGPAAVRNPRHALVSRNEAKAKVFGPFEAEWRSTGSTMPEARSPAPPDLADKIARILSSRGLSLAEVSRASASRPGHGRPHVPHNLYSSLRKRSFSPSLHQVFALSVHSGYRLADWLAVFGFRLSDVSRFQLTFPTLRTVELDPRIYDHRAAVAWFREHRAADFSAPMMPVGRWLGLARGRLSYPVAQAAKPLALYVKIGSEDAFAYPELLPGSIVRVERSAGPGAAGPGKATTKKLFLVEHSRGLTCTRLGESRPGRFVLCSRQLPYAPVELQKGTEGVVRGTADLEIRPLDHRERPVATERYGRFWAPAALAPASNPGHVGEYLRRARARSGLSFREASRRTKLIAEALGDVRYYCAAGSLSDFEARELPPRHIHKILSVCAVYFASFAGLLEAAGTTLEQGGNIPIPAELFAERSSFEFREPGRSAFLAALEAGTGELPYFLAGSLAALFGFENLSMHDVFWAGDTRSARDCPLAGTLFLVVDRKRKVPRPSLSLPAWQQPIYVLALRDGSYRAGVCSLEDGLLILRSGLPDPPEIVRLRHRVDAEVVGKVAGVVRRL
jgi:hypothetical protein